MYSLPRRSRRQIKRKPECQITIEKVSFIRGPPKQIEVAIENSGDADCAMKGNVSIKLLAGLRESEVAVVWKPISLPPDGASKTAFSYEWTNGAIYIVEVTTEEGKENWACEKAP